MTKQNEMKATELRIGNLIYFMDELIDVKGVDFGEKIRYDNTKRAQSQSHFNPIPLTEEWLKRCDWENRKDKDLAVSFGLTSGKVHFVCGNYYTECDTVHHFQNLYHALTGQELELKSEQ